VVTHSRDRSTSRCDWLKPRKRTGNQQSTKVPWSLPRFPEPVWS
jgi:hypothetical protein